MKATAVAHPNIALVKYWGKRDEALNLPHQSSLSMTLEGLSVTTTVELSERAEDAATLDGRHLDGEELQRIVALLDLVRSRAGLSLKARVASKTDFPKAAGLASSAAGGAALAAAACWAAGLQPEPRELSLLARRYSGSACRSIEGGFCEWRRGQAEDGSDSYAVQVVPETFWPELRMVVVICADEVKDVSSREGMRRTVETSPYFQAWARTAEEDVSLARTALLGKDFSSLGALAERSAWRMHACAMAADPRLLYLRPTTLAVAQMVEQLRAAGVGVWLTLDAGPNPVILCLANAMSRLTMRLSSIAGIQRTVIAAPGRGVERAQRPVF